MDHRFRALTALLFVAALCLVAPAAFAQAQLSYPSPGRAVVLPGVTNSIPSGTSRQIVREAANAKIIDTIKAQVAANASEFDVRSSRSLSASGLARALGRAGARAIPVVGAGVLAADAYCALGGEGWLCDPMKPATEEIQWCFQISGSYFCARNPAAAYTQWAGQKHATFQHGPDVSKQLTGSANCRSQNNGYYCDGMSTKLYLVQGGGYVGEAQWFGSPQQRPQEICEPDGTPPGANGKCPTGDMQPATEQQVEERVVPSLQPAIETHTRKALEHGVDVTPELSPVAVTGPESVVNPAKTTTLTDPAGNPQTRTEQVTNHFHYAGDTITWTNVTTITNPDGSTEVIDERPKEDEKSECEKNPEAVACQKLDVPAGPELEKKDVPVTFSPDSGWGGDGGGCPAPQQMSVLGQPVTFDNSLVCGFLSGIRPAVVAIFALAGVFIFIGGLKS